MRSLRLAALTAALVVLPAAAAWAHPSLNPNAVPVGQPVDTVLVVPHGCSTGADVMPEEGEAVPTTRVDLQLVDGVVVEPEEVDGWDATDDGEAIVWTDAGGATIDPIELPLTLTVTDGTAGQTLELAAFQECEDGSSYRWTPGSADTPPVRLELTEGVAGNATETASDAPASATASVPEPSATEARDDATDTPTAEAAAVEDGGDGSNAGAISAIIAVFVVLLGAGVFARRRGGA